MAAALLQHALDAVGIDAQVSSAGVTASVASTVDRTSVHACRSLGLDISAHRPRPLSAAVIGSDGRDLVITMTRAHLRDVVVRDRSVWPRVFTIRELARRMQSAPAMHGTLDQLREALHAGRVPRDLLGDASTDDVVDPYGAGMAAVRTTAEDLQRLCGTIAHCLSSTRAARGATSGECH
jgi:protein-tyrosine phosphatase